MSISMRARSSQRGQMIALFAISLTVIIMFVGLVVDGGNALVQRRGAQNASDFAALAGARVIAVKIGGDIVNGTDANVVDAIAKSIAVNKGTSVTFGSPNGPRYVDATGGNLAFVGNGTIPTDGRRRHRRVQSDLAPVLPWHRRHRRLDGLRGRDRQRRVRGRWSRRGCVPRRHRGGVLQ